MKLTPTKNVYSSRKKKTHCCLNKFQGFLKHFIIIMADQTKGTHPANERCGFNSKKPEFWFLLRMFFKLID